MKRTMTGLCVAAAFGFVASLGAQTSTATSQPPTSASDSKDITVTGCLERGANGNYVLANAHIDQSMDRSTGTTGTTGTSTTATGTSATSSSASSMSAAGWKLEGGTDLDKHVGHKVSVTGRDVSSSDRDLASASTSAGTTAGTTGTTATTSTTGTTGQAASQRQASDTGHKLDVKSVKMIAANCS